MLRNSISIVKFEYLKSFVMKKLLIIAALFAGIIATAQEVKPTIEQLSNDVLKVTYYYEDGSVSQIGTFKDNKRHGEWISYNLQGEKTAQAEYTNGEKSGKWFFWNGNQLREVDYNNNAVVAVNTWINENPVATNRP